MAFRSCGSVIFCPFFASQVVVSRLSLMALLIWMYSMSVLYALVLQCMLRLSMLLPYDNVVVLFL